MAYQGILFVDDLAVTVNCRTAMKALSGYFNLCLSVKFDSLSCSFTSIAFLTKGNQYIIRQHKLVNNLIFTPIIIIHCKHNVGILSWQDIMFCCDCMVVRLTTTYAINAYHH